MRFTFETTIIAFKNYDDVHCMLYKYEKNWQLTFHTCGLKVSATMTHSEFESFLQMIYDRRREISKMEEKANKQT